MDSSIGMERLYYLGDFRNIKVSSYISGISEESRLDQEQMTFLRTLQMIEVEKTYYQYRIMAKEVAEGFDTDEQRFERLLELEDEVLSILTEVKVEEIEEVDDGSENG